MMSTAPRRGKAKIKPPRKHGPDTSINETWTMLTKNIREIHNHNASNLSFEENYRYAYNMVLYKQGDLLYNGVNKLVAENINQLADTEVKPAFPTSVGGDRAQRNLEVERFLKAVRHAWDDHTRSMSLLRDIMKYMDRVYTPSAGVPVIWDSGMKLFLENMIKSPIREHIIGAILNQLESDREGYAVNRSAVKSVVDILLTLHESVDGPSVYKRDVEPEILRESRTFYSSEAQTLLETCDSPEYLRRVEERFTSEESRAHHYLSSQTALPLQRILEETLLTPQLEAVMSMANTGLDNMVDLEQVDNLARLYRLYSRVPSGLPALKRALKDLILRKGMALNESAKDNDNVEDVKGKGKGKARVAAATTDAASKWVDEVLSLKERFDVLWRRAFLEDREIESAMNEAFQSFVNKNARAPEFISLFIDAYLKKGLKGKTDQETETILTNTIVVFRYVSDKDVFERYYKLHLAKRLLYQRSVSDDAERGMLERLKVECGFAFTQKLEGMFTDMRVSADITGSFKRQEKTSAMPIDFELSVTIMTSNKWPSNMTQPSPQCNLPPLLSRACKSFEMFYLSRHSGRRLAWQLNLGNADIRVAFKQRKHDLNVSTLALVILLLFERLAEGEFLTFEELRESTALPEIELKRQLQSLACANFKVLKKHPQSREVSVTDSFSFNNDFVSNLQKIKIATISATSKAENAEERKETQDRVEEERKHQIDACIVRIMKNRKHMTHNDLMNEVTRQLSSRFLPVPTTIKKRVENLIEREFLERCEDRKSYNYLA